MRRLALPLFLLTVILATAASTRSVRAGSASPRFRIGVVQDGIVRLTADDLAAAGLELSALDPRTFSLSSQGQAVALRLNGGEDGSFDSGDSIEFYGQRFRGDEMAEKYTDENVYWLESGGEPGPRIPDQDATPTGELSPPADFAASRLAEENNFWYTQHRLNPPTLDTWFWDELQPVLAGRGITRTYEALVPYPAASGPVTLTVELNARVENATVDPDHRTTIAFNGVPLRDDSWDGKRRQVFTAPVPPEALHHGQNGMTLGVINPPGVASNHIYLNHWRLDYRRQFRAWQGQLSFTSEQAGPQEFESEGWAGADVHIWDISDPLAPRRLTGAAGSTGESGSVLRFRASGPTGSHYWLQENDTIQPPHSLRLQTPEELRNPAVGADVIIITSAALRPAAGRLAAWHRSQGRAPRVIDFLDAVDEFNDGIYHPQAVPALLAWAQAHWPEPNPRYLVLLGDGHWNFKGYNPAKYPSEPIHVPPYLAWVDPWQGEVPADNRYADLDGDFKPDLAVGRIPAGDLDQAQAVVDKIVSYEGGRRLLPWQRTALFVADNADDAGDFAFASDLVIASSLPPDLQASRIYLGLTEPDAAAARAAIAEGIEAGALLVQYSGHGSPQSWAHEDIWTVADVAGLDNPGHWPLIMSFNCLDGYFAQPGIPSLAESMLLHEGGGSIAAISPSGLGTTSFQQSLRLTLMEVLFEEDVRELGPALQLAKARFYDRFGPNYLIETVTLFGDPALALPAGLDWTYLPLVNP